MKIVRYGKLVALMALMAVMFSGCAELNLSQTAEKVHKTATEVVKANKDIISDEKMEKLKRADTNYRAVKTAKSLLEASGNE